MKQERSSFSLSFKCLGGRLGLGGGRGGAYWLALGCCLAAAACGAGRGARDARCTIVHAGHNGQGATRTHTATGLNGTFTPPPPSPPDGVLVAALAAPC
jgi:hypothetical protein